MRSKVRDALLLVAARAIARPSPGDPGRLLIVQPDHLGDIILSEPAVRLIRHNLPDHELIAVVGPWSEEIALLAWRVDRVVTVGFPGFERAVRGGRLMDPYARLRRESRGLRRLRASNAVVLRDDGWWAAWLARLSTSGQVVTSDHRQAIPFSTAPIATDTAMHNTEKAHRIAAGFLQVLGARVGEVSQLWDMSPAVALPPDVLDEARQLRARHGIVEPYVVVHPGAGAEVKTWPERHWRALLRDLDPMRVVITGNSAERDSCGLLAGGLSHVTNLAGATSLPALAGLVHDASLTVGTDNGPVHLAAAAGTPTVRLFGPSSAKRYGPFPESPDHIVIDAGWNCPRCGDLSAARPAGCGCMAAITPGMVLHAIEKVLADVP